MCGIVGAISDSSVTAELFEMLKRLDYRGYDSSGISVLSNKGAFEMHKKSGKLEQLEKLLTQNPINGISGIGHTRWATHGSPTDVNAHPHISVCGAVSVVHNGIIENYRELKLEFLNKGIPSLSDTDSEVITLIVQELVDANPDISEREIVTKLSQTLEGAYSLAIQISTRPNQIIGMSFQCPLNFVQTENFAGLSSDLSSLVKYSSKVGVLKDGQAIVLRRDGFELFDFEGKQSEPLFVQVEWTPEQASKQGYSHYLRKEIDDEPSAVRSLVQSISSTRHDLESYFSIEDIDQIVFVACGSASYSGQFASILFRDWKMPISTTAEIGSEFRYKPVPLSQKALIVAVSQSGETADTIGAVNHSLDAAAKSLSFVNVVGSSLGRLSGVSLQLGAGPEVAVPSTKAVVNQFLATTLVTCIFKYGHNKGFEFWKNGCEKVADAILSIIKMEKDWESIAKQISGHQSSFALGRGLDFPLALEMALKLKESAYMHGEAMYAGEFKHGSISLIEYGMPVFCFLSDSSVRSKTVSNIEEIKARGAQPFIFDSCSPKDEDLSHLGEYYRLPDIGSPWSSIAMLACIHLISFHTGVIRGVDVDRPRNLAKSVTVE